MATISDVAREAQVSVATVSRVLNKQDSVKKATADRVYAAIEKLKFEPNILARNFRRSESRVILIIAPNITNPYYSHILTGIGDTANELGYSALIFNTANSEEREKEGMEMLKKRRADGAILLARNQGSQWLEEYAENYPVVQCSEYDPQVPFPHVSIDNYKAVREVMAYLFALGHERIATISSKNRYISTDLRMKAYKDALVEEGLPVEENLVAYAGLDYSFRSGKEAAEKLLAQENRPTAIFCISDTIALGAIAAAMEKGIRVPEDLTVIGFDDVEDTMMFHPYITTVGQPCYELGKNAMRMLYDRINGQLDPQHEMVLKHKFIIRESAGRRKQDD